MEEKEGRNRCFWLRVSADKLVYRLFPKGAVAVQMTKRVAGSVESRRVAAR